MKKIVTLASVVTLVVLMVTAAPAFAQTGQGDQGDCPNPPGSFVEFDGTCFKPGNCPSFIRDIGGVRIDQDRAPEEVQEFFRGNQDLCRLELEDIPPGFPPEDGDRDRDRDRDGFFDFDEPFISQDIEQEAESGDITQNFDVSQTGDNSNQTVGIQGTANTGNAQNVTNVVDAGPFVGDFDNNDGNDGFFNDGFIICDFDNDGDNDGDNEECEDFNNNNDDDGFVIFPDFNDGDRFFDNGDQFFVNGDDDGDIEIEDSGASITMSPTNTTNSHQEVNQAAAASAPQWVLTASGWMLV